MRPHVPMRQITRGPRHHWFGYYDKLQFDPTGRYALGMSVGFEGRQPAPDDEIRVGMVDLHDGDRWIELGRSRAWCWQQGCMLQWIPGSESEVVWNDREGDRFVARILDVRSGRGRTLPMPIYALSPDGRSAVTIDFARLDEMRPGYGYAGGRDPRADAAAPDDSGIWRVDLASGAAELLVSLAEATALPWTDPALRQRKTWFNHLLFDPSGRRVVFLHRCTGADGRGLHTRMCTIGARGEDLRCIDPHGHGSHFIWTDDSHVLVWTRIPPGPEAYYLLGDGDGTRRLVGEGIMAHNGHVTCVPGTRSAWILDDTYPLGAERLQQLYLYHVPTGRRIELGAFPSPADYRGAWRCDLHPRTSPDGRSVCIDSAHGGTGRQMHLLGIGGIIDAGAERSRAACAGAP